jgi:hypothetical protein
MTTYRAYDILRNERARLFLPSFSGEPIAFQPSLVGYQWELNLIGAPDKKKFELHRREHQHRSTSQAAFLTIFAHVTVEGTLN